jgi:hypothetical protein
MITSGCMVIAGWIVGKMHDADKVCYPWYVAGGAAWGVIFLSFGPEKQRLQTHTCRLGGLGSRCRLLLLAARHALSKPFGLGFRFAASKFIMDFMAGRLGLLLAPGSTKAQKHLARVRGPWLGGLAHLVHQVKDCG